MHPTDQNRLGRLNHVVIEVFVTPASAVSVIVGCKQRPQCQSGRWLQIRVSFLGSMTAKRHGDAIPASVVVRCRVQRLVQIKR